MTVIDGLTNTWDFKDRLVAVENASMRARYIYDYTDRRICKIVWQKHSLAPAGGEGQGEGVAPPLTTLYIDKYFEVRDHDAPVKYVWNGNTRVARVTGSLNSSQRVQRIRLWPGYNLLSVAVACPYPLWGVGRGELLNAAYRWNPPTLTWLPVATNETLAAGSVLWVQAATNGLLTFTGGYSDPTNVPVTNGPNFLPVPGLETLTLTNSNAQLATDQWCYDAQNQLWQIALAGPLTNFNSLPPTLAPGEVLFVRADAITQMVPTDRTLHVMYYHEDHLGSSSLLSDRIGLVVSEFANYAFGANREMFSFRNIGEPYQFTQKEKDAESSLSYFEARYISSLLCRFIIVDPFALTVKPGMLADPQRGGVYSYCSNRPLKYCDPTGCEESKSENVDPIKATLHVMNQACKFINPINEQLKRVVLTGKTSSRIETACKQIENTQKVYDYAQTGNEKEVLLLLTGDAVETIAKEACKLVANPIAKRSGQVAGGALVTALGFPGAGSYVGAVIGGKAAAAATDYGCDVFGEYMKDKAIEKMKENDLKMEQNHTQQPESPKTTPQPSNQSISIP